MILFIPIFSVIYTLIRVSTNRRLEERGIVVEEEEYAVKKKTPGKISQFFSSLLAKIKAKFAERKPKHKK